MKNILLGIMLWSLLLLDSAKADNHKYFLSDLEVIGYAYLKNGGESVEISPFLHEIPNDTEIVLISKNGFYPNYNIGKTESQKSANCGNKSVNKNSKFCNSAFTEQTAGDAAYNVTMNALFAPIASLATGEVRYGMIKTFNVDKFLTTMESLVPEKSRNQLLDRYNKIQELIAYEQQKNNDLDAIYNKAYLDYTNNANLISFNYTYIDKSGLAPKKMNFTGDYKVVLNSLPTKEALSSLVNQAEFSMENYSAEIVKKKEMIDQRFISKSNEYSKLLKQQFSVYKIAGSDTLMFKHNDYISFNATLKGPSEIPNTGKKVTINIPIEIKSAQLKNMIPNVYTLSDSNFAMQLKPNPNLTINSSMMNKTKSFVTVKSITGYYQGDVLNVTNLDKELSPEAGTVQSGETYHLFSNKMQMNTNFEDITEAKANNIKIDYGYAVKYRMNDTNIEKSIYNTKKFSLYDIYKQYL